MRAQDMIATLMVRTAIAAILVLLIGGAAVAQFGFERFGSAYRPLPNIPYDGRFTFVRVRYSPSPGGYWPGRRPSWIHGYPIAERNLIKIMNEGSFIEAHEDINSVTLDGPDVLRHPLARSIKAGRCPATDSL